MKNNGTARLVAFDDFINWYAQLPLEEAEAVCDKLKPLTAALQVPGGGDAVTNCLRKMFGVPYWSSYPPSETKEAKWPAAREQMLLRLRRFFEFAGEFQQPVRVQVWEDGAYAYLFLGNPDTGIVVPQPERYLEYVPEVDYSRMTPSAVRHALNAPGAAQETSLVPAAADSSMTTAGVAELLRGREEEIRALNEQMEDVRKARTGELAELQAQIQKMQEELAEKKSALMAELKEKMAEMERVKENLENQIYLLDSQIYSIRCYAGEVVRFARILSGKNAPVSEPIVIHQKLRFLDEELGTLASLYEIHWNNIGMFEDFLKHSPLALDTFAPNERCVTLVRLSRSAKQLDRNSSDCYSNMLEEYEYYHGRTVGIIIRNGENVYLGWTDEERVHIDDDLIISQVITEVTPGGEEPKFTFESERERYLKEQKEKRRKMVDGIVSRSFVYNILQGIVDNSAILPLPAGVKLNKQSEYVVYSVADRWVTDNRYGDFTEIVARCNEKVVKGDMLLTVQHLIPEHTKWDNHHYYGHDRAWDNAWGRGDANRTHDCSVDDCTIYPANLVEYDDPVSMTRYRRLVEPDYFTKQKNPDAKPYWSEERAKTSDYEYIAKSNTVEHIETYEYRKPHVFVSVKKTESWRWDGYKSDARANFELYKDEYINLTYLNSIWLQWVITNKKVGGWTVGGRQVDYAYAIRYLKVAMDFVRERESREKAVLDAFDPGLCQMPEWQVRLSEWKLSAGVREITAYQAKRFANTVRQGAAS